MVAHPPPTIKQSFTVALNLDDLEQGTEVITITLPNNDVVSLSTDAFRPGGGYEFSDEEEIALGYPPFYIPPGTERYELTYRWEQSTDEYDIMFVFNQGVVYGYLNGNTDRYIIKNTYGNNGFIMYEMKLSDFPEEDRSFSEATIHVTRMPDDHEVTFKNLKHFKAAGDSDQQTTFGSQPAPVIDMLILYDAEARTNENTDPNNPNSSLGIETLIQTAVANSNLALENSQAQTRVSGFYVAEVTGVQTNNNGFQNNLLNLRNNSSVRTLRNQIGADVISMIVGISQHNWGACGYSFVQTHPKCGFLQDQVPDCNDGNDFNDYAYNMVTSACAIDDDTFTHELGHLMGANHARDEFLGVPNWPTEVVQNGYQEAFGYHHSNFYSIMTIGSTSTRRLYFSNPNVLFNGHPTGVANTRHNQYTIDQLSPVMSTLRERPDLIFADGFE